MAKRKLWKCPKMNNIDAKICILDVVRNWEEKDDLTPEDRSQMTRAAQLLDTSYCAREEVLKYGLLIEGQRGLMVQNPAVKIGNDAYNQYLAILKECGLTKRSRKILKDEISEPAQLTELEDLLLNGN